MARTPQIRRHKASDQVIVYLDGAYRYFGPWRDPKSHRQAEQKIAEYLVRGRRLAPPPTTMTIAQLIDLYSASGQASDRRDARALPLLAGLYGESLVAEFSRSGLKAVRLSMVEKNWTRQDINLCVQRLKRLFRWAEDEKHVTPAVLADVNGLRGLKRGQAREGEKVRPVEESAFRKAVCYLPFPLRAVAELQYLTGARAGELLQLRPMDIDRDQSPWAYEPIRHKTQHLDQERVIYFGPQAQSLLSPFLDRPADQLCFRPRDVRKTHGEQYTVSQYGRLIGHACKRAGVDPWHSHQLRHSALTRTRAEFGPDAAQGMAGHKNMRMTEHYAKVPMTKAAEAAKLAG